MAIKMHPWDRCLKPALCHFKFNRNRDCPEWLSTIINNQSVFRTNTNWVESHPKECCVSNNRWISDNNTPPSQQIYLFNPLISRLSIQCYTPEWSEWVCYTTSVISHHSKVCVFCQRMQALTWRVTYMVAAREHLELRSCVQLSQAVQRRSRTLV